MFSDLVTAYPSAVVSRGDGVNSDKGMLSAKESFISGLSPVTPVRQVSSAYLQYCIVIMLTGVLHRNMFLFPTTVVYSAVCVFPGVSVTLPNTRWTTYYQVCNSYPWYVNKHWHYVMHIQNREPVSVKGLRYLSEDIYIVCAYSEEYTLHEPSDNLVLQKVPPELNCATAPFCSYEYTYWLTIECRH